MFSLISMNCAIRQLSWNEEISENISCPQLKKKEGQGLLPAFPVRWKQERLHSYPFSLFCRVTEGLV
jgi:hypothetical protein